MTRSTTLKGPNGKKLVMSTRASRKRTKTGCLVCRKRRIKCGEEKPICANCVKSRRDCDGYESRIIFRELTNDATSPASSSQLSGGSFPLHDEALESHDGNIHKGTTISSLPMLPPHNRPKPPDESQICYGAPCTSSASATSHWFATTVRVSEEAHAGPFSPLRTFPHYQPNPSSSTCNPTAWTSGRCGICQPGDAVLQPPEPNHNDFRSNFQLPLLKNTFGPQAWSEHPCQYQDRIHRSEWTKESAQASSDGWDERGYSSTASHSDGHAQFYDRNLHEPASLRYSMQGNGMDYHNLDVGGSQGRQLDYSVAGHRDITETLVNAAVEFTNQNKIEFFPAENGNAPSQSSRSKEDDKQPHFSMMQSRSKCSNNVSLRRISARPCPGMLDHYRPENVASPLQNPYTAHVFTHFLTVTGPTLSVFERTKTALSGMFDQASIPIARQTLWTSSLPMMALHNQGLLHAMLAVSSLHIAKLYKASSTPSYKHYAYSLKHVHSAVSQGIHHQEVTILAATLLLGFYEVMTAEHTKWSAHLCGASKLIHEIDFAGKTMRCVRQTSRKIPATSRSSHGQRGFSIDSDDISLENGVVSPNSADIDFRLVRDLMGKNLPYVVDGSTVDGNTTDHAAEERCKDDELHSFEVLQDLYWWYCKHDTVHSIIGANPLLVEFDHWTNCPPRAPIGLPHAVYGSFDHLVLIFGRLADFIHRDRKRKIMVNGAKSSGAHGPPPASATPTTHKTPSMSFLAERHHHRTLRNHTPPMQQKHFMSGMPPVSSVPFYGMAPPSGRVSLPRAFGKNDLHACQSSPESVDLDVEAATAQALEEWNDILTSCIAFAAGLGESFQPVDHQDHRPFMTSFGPVILYRQYDIALLWMWYYLVRIVAARCHPSMPPAATVAVGAAASQTAFYSNEIGRIASGIAAAATGPHADPFAAGAYADCTMPLFFAGVEYQTQEQRAWTIECLLGIERSSGWGSAGRCATGCEMAWIRAAEMGVGPPYERVVRDMESGDPSRGTSSLPTRTSDERFDPHGVLFNEDHHGTWAIGLLGTTEDLDKPH